MFCKIKKIRNLLLISFVVGLAFYMYQSNKDYVLTNDDESTISTKIQKPAMIVFLDFRGQDSKKNQENFTAMVLAGKAYNLFKNYMRVVAVVHADDDRMLREFNILKKKYEFDIEIFFDKKNRFAKKFSAHKKPTTILVKDGKVKYKSEDFMFRWFDIDGISLINKHLGVTIGM